MRLATPIAPLVILVSILASTGAAAPADATLQITTQALPPSGPQVLLASPAPADHAAGDAYEVSHGAGAAVGVGQTFRLGGPATLDRITLLARPVTDQVAGETVVLTLGRFSGAADVVPDEVLAIASAVLPQALPAGEEVYLVLDLDDLALEADRQHGFLLEFAGGGNVNNARMELFHTGADTYAAGEPFLHEGSSFEAENDDLVFFLEGVGDEEECPALPDEAPLTTPELPGFRFWLRFGDPATGTWTGLSEPLCTPETLCVSGALPGRTEALVRIVGPKPNGYLWPTLVKLSTSRIEVWIEQVSSGAVRCYVLPGAEPGGSELPGLFDRTGFLP